MQFAAFGPRSFIYMSVCIYVYIYMHVWLFCCWLVFFLLSSLFNTNFYNYQNVQRQTFLRTVFISSQLTGKSKIKASISSSSQNQTALENGIKWHCNDYKSDSFTLTAQEMEAHIQKKPPKLAKDISKQRNEQQEIGCAQSEVEFSTA